MPYKRHTGFKFPSSIPEQPFNGVKVCIPAELIPTLLGALMPATIDARYGTGIESFESSEAIRGLMYMLMKPCNDYTAHIYTLLDSVFNGTIYSNVGTIDEPILSPAISLVPETPDIPVLTFMQRLEGLIAQGILGEDADSPYPVSEDVLTVLKQIRDGAEGMSEEEIADLLSLLAQIAAAL